MDESLREEMGKIMGMSAVRGLSIQVVVAVLEVALEVMAAQAVQVS